MRYPGSPLKLGSKGPAVTALQHELNHYGNRLKVDGTYGARTAATVEAFERHRGYGVDGITDAVIWALIFRQSLPILHPRDPETRADKLRRLREEIVLRQSQIKHNGDPKRLRALHVRIARLHAAVAALAKPDRLTVIGNRAIGGSPRARLRALALAAYALDQAGHRIQRYSQPGTWTINYPVTGEPSGFRSDCSEWFTALYHAAGLLDPNHAGFIGGFTGTLAEHGTRVSAAEADWGDAVIWDPWGPQGHVAMHTERGSGNCIGHGSPPIHLQPISVFSYKGAPIYVRYL